MDTGSLFLLQSTTDEFFRASGGVTFSIADYDVGTKSELIGSVVIPQEDLLESNGEKRLEYEIEVVLKGYKASDSVFTPKLVIRCRRAEEEDLKFMQQYGKIKRGRKLGVYADATFVAPKPHSVKLLKRETREKEGVVGLQHRVKPGPDPDREEQATKWLTEEQIENEAYKPSTKWIESGSGTLGELYVEVIGCDGLPNLDLGLGPRNKTDAFCTIIFEDAIVSTDVINGKICFVFQSIGEHCLLVCFSSHLNNHQTASLLVGCLGLNGPSSLTSIMFRPSFYSASLIMIQRPSTATTR